MAKISTYPADATPTLSDYLIGTDVNNANNTKTYTIGSIIGAANLAATYVPYTGANQAVNLGSNNLTFGNNAYILFPYSNSGISFPGGSSTIGTVGLITANTTSTYTLQTYNLNLQGANASLQLNADSGTSGQFLQSNGAGVTPSWSNLEKGSFFSLLTQFSVAATNMVILDQVDSTVTNGISVVTNGANLTRITFTKAGVYNIRLNANIVTGTSSSGHSLSFYLRKNGTGTSTTGNITNTARYFTSLPNSQSVSGSCYWSVSVSASDYIEVMAINTSATYQIQQVPAAGNAPVCPSVSVSVTRAL
jgi:hypothetical protein